MVFSQDTWWIMGLLVAAAISIISFFLKRNINQTDSHERDINEIKRTYVTKDEMKDLKDDTERTMSKLQSDVEEIKECCLTKKEYYKSINEVKQEIRDQNKLIIDLIKEGRNNGT